MMSERELYRYQNGESLAFATLPALRARLRRQHAGPADAAERWWNWAIFKRGSERDTALGTIELSLGPERALLAYALGQAWWGRGYACEAAAAALAHLRTAAGVRFVDAFIDTRNARSIALARRLGLVRIAFLPHNDVIDGLPSDDDHYRIDLTKDGPWHA